MLMTIKRKSPTILGFHLLVGATLTLADALPEDELLSIYGSEDFISIATGYKQPVSKAPAVASVISAKDIKNQGALDLNDVLESIPGLHVSYSTQGYNPIFTFRGIYSGFNPQVLLLFNGVPVSSLFVGNRSNTWGGMPVEAIQRIEVIRGPGSAIYGADAFAGVINIIFEDADSIGDNRAGLRYGEHNTKELFGKYKKHFGENALSLTYQIEKTDGFDALITRDTQSSLDEITGTSASLTPGNASLGREAIDLNLSYSYRDLEINTVYQGRFNGGSGIGVVQSLDRNSEFDSERLIVDLTYSIEPEAIPDLTTTINANFLHSTQEVGRNVILFPPGSTGPFLDAQGNPLFGVFEDGVIGNPELFERHSRFNITSHYEGFLNHDFTLGLGYYYGDLYKTEEEKNYCTDPSSCSFILPQLSNGGLADVSDTPFVFLQESDRTNYFVFLQDIYTVANDWQLTAGVRFDHYDDFGSTTNPRLALVWSTTNNLTTKLLYGEAFRAPAFAETRAINNPSSLGNPDLKPETLKSTELVFDYTVNYDLSFIFNAFYYEWDDIIQFVPDEVGGTSTAQNTNTQTGHGLEIEAVWSPTPALKLFANVAYQTSTSGNHDSTAANSPQKQFYLRADWSVDHNYFLSLESNWVLDRARLPQDSRPQIDDYLTTNLTARRADFIVRNMEFSILVKNIFDVDAKEPTPKGIPAPGIPNDLPLMGRSLFGEIRYKF